MKQLITYIQGIATGLLAFEVFSYASAPEAKVKASWYGEDYRGKIMANGSRFDPDVNTCASNNYPLGTNLFVSTGDGWAVEVQVTDRMSKSAYASIDLSRHAFAELADPDIGIIDVKIKEAK